MPRRSLTPSRLPALVANLPAAIDAAIQQFLAFNAAYPIQQPSSQIGLANYSRRSVKSHPRHCRVAQPLYHGRPASVSSSFW